MACNQGQVCFQFNQITLKPNAGIAKVQKELKKKQKKKLEKPKPCYTENREQKN